MKKSILTPFLLLSASFLVACGSNPQTDSIDDDSVSSALTDSSENGSSSSSDEPVETYDVIFKDGDTVVAEYLDQTPGSYVDVPILEAKARYELIGWTGLSDKDFKNGKARVYEADQIYVAIWDERFGTDNVYTATALTSSESITVDGTKDAAYSDAMKIDIASSSCAATAEAYVMYDVNNLYVFIEVADTTNYPHKESGQNANSCDSVGLYLDLMHDDSLAAKPYTDGWGKAYRGEPGPMVEGMYKISRGFVGSESKRYSDAEGSTFVWDGWLSNAAKDTGCNTIGTTYETSKGYNVEYRIELTNPNIPEEYKPKAGNEFGLGVILYDQTTDTYDATSAATSRCGIEDLNLEAELGPKKLSNFRYEKNAKEDRTGIKAVKTRDCYSVSSENARDDLFKDATATDVAGSTFEVLYDESNYYFYIQKGADTNGLKLAFDGATEAYSIDTNKKIIVPIDNKYFEVSYADGEETKTEKFYLVNSPNMNNCDVARKMYTTKYTSEAITVDGELDAAYDESVKFDVNYQSLVESGPIGASAVAYSMFDDDYFYLFVDVTDSNVDSTTVNASNPEQNDCVQLWMSTTQVLPTSTTAWGLPNRPNEGYCGEGMFTVRAGGTCQNWLTGFHWLYDNASMCPREIKSKLTDKGYTVEYKIGWASFKNNVKNGEIIDFMICVSDGEGNEKGITGRRHGVVCTNQNGHMAYDKPYWLDHIQLAGK